MSKSGMTCLPQSVIDAITRTTEPYLGIRGQGNGVCSAKMRLERRRFFLLMLSDLWRLGHRIRKLESLSSRHVKALMEHWHTKGICAGTLRCPMSV